MKERERGKGQGKSRRRPGLLASRFSWWVLGGGFGGGGVALKRTVGSMMVL